MKVLGQLEKAQLENLVADPSPASLAQVYWNTVSNGPRVYDGTTWRGMPLDNNIARDDFSGDGTTVNFTLSISPPSKNNTNVFISGVYQEKSTYSVAGNILTFNTAPASGTNNIEVMSTSGISIGVPGDDTVSTIKIQDGAVTTAKLADGSVTLAKLSTTSGLFFPPNYTNYLSGSGTFGLSRWFLITAGNATAGAIYTNNTFTFTVVSTIVAGTSLLCTSTGAPTNTGTLTKTSGTGDATITFTSVRKPLAIEIEMVGGGGGGSGSGGTQPVGSAGTSTTFSASLTASGGAGSSGTAPGAGGSTTVSLGTGLGVSGSGGGGGGAGSSSAGLAGGSGGCSAFGGNGSGGGLGLAGTAAATNSGSGGGGGGMSATNGVSTGGGGGSGGYINTLITNSIADTYAYAVGAGGSGGAAGASGFAGGVGAGGRILVKEIF